MILRNALDRPLTHEELDKNFKSLNTSITTEIANRDIAIANESSKIHNKIDNLDLSGEVSQSDINAINLKITNLKSDYVQQSDFNSVASKVADLESDYIQQSDLDTTNSNVSDLKTELESNYVLQTDLDTTINDAISTEVTNRDNAISSAIANVSVVDHVMVDADITAAKNQYLLVDNTNNISVTLPATPDQFTTIYILDIKGLFNSTPLNVLRNGETIMGNNSDTQLNTDNKEYKLIYTGSDWRII